MAKATKPPSEGASTHRALSIAVTYPAVLSFVMGLVVLLMGLLTTAGMQRSTRGLLDQLIHQVTERMRLAVVDSLDTPYRVSGLLATDLRTGRLVARDRADLEELIPELAALGRAFPSIGSVLLATPNDDVVWVEQRADGSWKVVGFDHAGDGRAIERNLDAAGRPTAEVIASYPYAPEGRPWHRTATDGGERGAWIPLYVWATSEKIPPIGSGFAREVRDAEDRRLALIEVGFTNQGLSAQMGRISIGREGRAMIVDAAGNLVATDDPALKKSIDGRVLRALDIDDPILATVARATRDAPDTDAMNVRIVDDAGEGWEAESEPLGVAWGPDWRLVLAMPDRELLSGVRDVQGRMLLAGMLVLLGCGLLGFAVARSIVRPIIALRGTAAAIASGDLDARFSPRGGREFIELSRDLSSMTSGLRERIEMQGALEVAMEVQQNLLPQEPPQVEGLDIAATSIYSDETGGDYFDFPETDEDERAGHLAAIGDVTGHGIGAALIMASARSALRTQLRDAGGLGELL
ncbi:MAG: HAMP domain-containing protein, partial [Planctomycetota bacterium]|nr:HAMP domain-containing protein [Planctomycetota bacterium]